MTALWQNDGSKWRLLAPAGFPAEQALHDLVEEAPQLLPLAGAPQLVVVGREVQLGSGYADLIAIEPSGRIAVIEIKLAKSAEARRAVVAQVLSYAAYLDGSSVTSLERDVLGVHLRKRGHASLGDALASVDQEGAYDPAEFREAVGANLAAGRFRLVFVLDDAPDELVRLAGYLESISDKLVIDVVTVSAYDVAGQQVLVPQRIEPERHSREPDGPIPPPRKGRLVDGAEDFLRSIADAPEAERAKLRALHDWALALERSGLVALSTYHGVSGRKTLLPRLRDEGVGLVTLWNENGGFLQFWRSVFERRAPNAMKRVEALLEPTRLGQGNTTRDISEELLAAIADAYREAAA